MTQCGSNRYETPGFRRAFDSVNYAKGVKTLAARDNRLGGTIDDGAEIGDLQAEWVLRYETEPLALQRSPPARFARVMPQIELGKS